MHLCVCLFVRQQDYAKTRTLNRFITQDSAERWQMSHERIHLDFGGAADVVTIDVLRHSRQDCVRTESHPATLQGVSRSLVEGTRALY